MCVGRWVRRCVCVGWCVCGMMGGYACMAGVGGVLCKRWCVVQEVVCCAKGGVLCKGHRGYV